VRGIERLALENVRKQIALLATRAVELAAVDRAEETLELEVLEDAARERAYLRRAEMKSQIRVAQSLQQLGNPCVDPVLVHAERDEALAVELHGALDRHFPPRQELTERIAERRTDVAHESVVVGHLRTELRERVLDAAHDAVTRIGERAVEIEEDVPDGRAQSVSYARFGRSQRSASERSQPLRSA
jgi:hypothetical protein